MPDITEFSPDPPAETVKVGGKDLEVRGLSGRALAGLARKYPILVEYMNGRVVDGENTDAFLALLEMAPALVAVAARKAEDESAIAEDLSFAESFPALVKIIELTTAPVQQRGPFVESGGLGPLIEGSATK